MTDRDRRTWDLLQALVVRAEASLQHDAEAAARRVLVTRSSSADDRAARAGHLSAQTEGGSTAE